MPVAVPKKLLKAEESAPVEPGALPARENGKEKPAMLFLSQ